MGDRSLEVCVEEQLTWIREAIRLSAACGATAQSWYDDGANVEVLAECGDENVYESAVYAWGYLNGCADHCDMTVMEYLDSIGLSLDERPPCLASMGCLCWGHALGDHALRPCDTNEKRKRARKSSPRVKRENHDGSWNASAKRRTVR